MNQNKGRGCVLSFPVVIIIFIITVVVVGSWLSSASRSFGEGYAEGGGSLELFSDDIIATNNGDGVTVAAKDSEIGDITNTPTEESGDIFALLQMCGIGLFFLLIAGAYVYLSSSSSSQH